MSDAVRRHYELFPYPHYPLVASVRRCDTYTLNLTALWTRFNGTLAPRAAMRILIAGCGSFAPYPFALANPDAHITALDLSRPNLRRARLHCALHGRRNVTFRCGDLLDPAAVDGRFGLIDAYGVLHHLEDPLAGLQALGTRLTEGGILRVMVYSRYARRQEESIRRAFRLLGVHEPAVARRLMARSRPGSRLRGFMDASDEAACESGLADALLHPCVHTFRIDAFMELVRQSGLMPLLFAHEGALEDTGQEIGRIRRLEEAGQSPGNFILYLGRSPVGHSDSHEGRYAADRAQARPRQPNPRPPGTPLPPPVSPPGALGNPFRRCPGNGSPLHQGALFAALPAITSKSGPGILPGPLLASHTGRR